MLVVIAQLFIHPGQEAAYRAYEEEALACFRAHGGEVLAAFRPRASADGTPTPYEIHVLRIGSEQAFADFRADFRADPALAALAELRVQAIARTELFVSDRVITY